MSNLNLKLLDTRRFADACGVVPETVRQWVRENKIQPWGRTPGGHMRFTEDQVIEAIRAAMSARARDIEAHVLSARAKLRMRRGRAG